MRCRAGRPFAERARLPAARPAFPLVRIAHRIAPAKAGARGRRRWQAAGPAVRVFHIGEPRHVARPGIGRRFRALAFQIV
ncbi:hypothetical protein DB771_01275 [Burkholderia sp. AU29985]|nr:hypothetical protein XM57_01555 [Burkholderia cepacia]AYZ95812.1 hypothetical protein EGY28_11625 [Burkholderia dolosa]ETP61517.1 hypothetical protein BDSB_27625 [Burkholderia dolosa PC543]PRE56417.1 hypothetical protein C6P87_02535 [Burkholderia sp. AU12872]PUA78687.1 hypothetical protein DB771_01275 [Burkholderia sp. AU29985]